MKNKIFCDTLTFFVRVDRHMGSSHTRYPHWKWWGYEKIGYLSNLGLSKISWCFMSKSTIFQSCRNFSQVDPVLSRGWSVLKDSTRFLLWGLNQRPLDLNLSTLPLNSSIRLCWCFMSKSTIFQSFRNFPRLIWSVIKDSTRFLLWGLNQQVAWSQFEHPTTG